MAGVGVLGDQLEGFAFTTAANQDPRPWLADRRGRQIRLLQLVVLAGKRPRVAGPGLVENLERFLQPFEAFLERRKWHAERVMLALVPRGADSQEPAALGQDVERRDLFEQHAGIAIHHACY